MFSVLLLILVALVSYYLWRQSRNYAVYWKIGGPVGWPIIGVGLQFTNQKQILYGLEDIKVKYGSLAASWLGPKFLIACSDPVLVKQILSSSACVDKTEFFRALECLMEKGILLSKGKAWFDRRKLLNPTFMQPILNSFFPIYNQVTNELTQRLAEHVGRGEFNPEEILAKGMLEIACQTTMGKKVNLLQDSNSKFFDHFSKELFILTKKLATPWFHNEFIYRWSQLYQLEMEYIDTVKNFTRKIISEKRDEQNAASQIVGSTGHMATEEEEEGEEYLGMNVKPKRIFVEQIFHHADNGTISWNDIDDEVTTILLTGADTLTTLTSMAILCLAIYEDCQKKLRAEIWEKYPPNDKGFEINFKDLKDMPYLDMVLNETLRLMPPVPILFRNVSEDFHLKEDIVLPQGTQTVIDVFHLHRDKDIWGPMADQFVPEHFLPDNLSKVHPFAFIPYSKGIRSCIGIKYSQYAAKLAIIRLFHSHRITTTNKLSDLKYTVAITLKLQEPFRIQIHNICDASGSS